MNAPLVFKRSSSAARQVVGVALMLGLVGGCASAPTVQLTAFSESLAAVRQVNKPIFADLALAEIGAAKSRPDRCTGMPQLKLPGGTSIRDGFCLGDVLTTANIIDPPDTASFEAGMTVLQVYTQTLTTLSSGASSADVSAQLQVAAGKLVSIAAAVGFGGGALAPAVSGAIGTLSPLIKAAAAQSSKAEARRLILSGSQQVHDLIAAEREGAPAIWAAVTSKWRFAIRLIAPNDIEGATSISVKIEAYRVIVANYVVLLDRLDTAWTDTVNATKHPQPATLADLTALASQINTGSDAMTKAFAALRAIPVK